MSENNVCDTSRCSKCRRRLPIEEFPRIERIGCARTVGYHCYDCKNRIQRERRGFTPRKSPEQRLAESLNIAGPDDCWEWTKFRQPKGYGRIRFRGRHEMAHRVAWMLANGVSELSRWQFICHRCDNPPCCNPAHLFLGTPLENMQDMIGKGRQRNLRGERHPQSSLTESDVLAIRAAYATREVSMCRLAKKWGMSVSGVADIIHRNNWKHVA